MIEKSVTPTVPVALEKLVTKPTIRRNTATTESKENRRLRSFISLFISAVAMVAAAQWAAIDWLHLDRWVETYLAYAIFICVASWHTPKIAMCLGFLFGFVSMSASFWWAEQMLAYSLNTQGNAPRFVFVTLVLWESIPFVVFAFLISWIRHTQKSSLGLLVPISVWILFGIVWPRVFTWEIGHTQLACLPVAQIADLGGGSIITWVVLWCAAIPQLLLDSRYALNLRRRRSAVIAIALVGLMVLSNLSYGYYQIARWNKKMESATLYSVGCIQENPADVTSIARMRSATDQLGERVDVICWPESTLGTHSQELASFRDLAEVAVASLPPTVDTTPLLGISAPLIVGGKSFSGPKADDVPYQQTAFLVDTAGQVLKHYHKRGLMPLGEYVPGEQYVPYLHTWFQLGSYCHPGVDDKPVTMPDGTKLGVLICYEDISPSIVRRTCLAGAEALVCIINASAFEQPIALFQHLRLAQLRTIENRRSLVRIAGTGISCTIRPTGEMIQMVAPYDSASFVAKINRFEDRTIYSLFGNWMFWLCATVAIAFCVKRFRGSFSDNIAPSEAASA